MMYSSGQSDTVRFHVIRATSMYFEFLVERGIYKGGIRREKPLCGESMCTRYWDIHIARVFICTSQLSRFVRRRAL